MLNQYSRRRTLDKPIRAVRSENCDVRLGVAVIIGRRGDIAVGAEGNRVETGIFAPENIPGAVAGSPHGHVGFPVACVIGGNRFVGADAENRDKDSGR